jgi:hypothetical protein
MPMKRGIGSWVHQVSGEMFCESGTQLGNSAWPVPEGCLVVWDEQKQQKFLRFCKNCGDVVYHVHEGDPDDWAHEDGLYSCRAKDRDTTMADPVDEGCLIVTDEREGLR